MVIALKNITKTDDLPASSMASLIEIGKKYGTANLQDYQNLQKVHNLQVGAQMGAQIGAQTGAQSLPTFQNYGNSTSIITSVSSPIIGQKAVFGGVNQFGQSQLLPNQSAQFVQNQFGPLQTTNFTMNQNIIQNTTQNSNKRSFKHTVPAPTLVLPVQQIKLPNTQQIQNLLPQNSLLQNLLPQHNFTTNSLPSTVPLQSNLLFLNLPSINRLGLQAFRDTIHPIFSSNLLWLNMHEIFGSMFRENKKSMIEKSWLTLFCIEFYKTSKAFPWKGLVENFLNTFCEDINGKIGADEKSGNKLNQVETSSKVYLEMSVENILKNLQPQSKRQKLSENNRSSDSDNLKTVVTKIYQLSNKILEIEKTAFDGFLSPIFLSNIKTLAILEGIESSKMDDNRKLIEKMKCWRNISADIFSSGKEIVEKTQFSLEVLKLVEGVGREDAVGDGTLLEFLGFDFEKFC